MLTFLRTGDWGPGDVDVERVDSGRRVVPEVEACIDRDWAEALARPGTHLFDGPMCRLERFDVSPGGRLRLALSPTTYKVFFGTNMSRPELADRFGPDVLADPVGVSPALETADGYLLLGRRNASVAYYPGRVHPFAGALDPADGGDVFAAVRRELREELSLQDADIGEIRCTGLVQDRSLRQTEMIFAARCRLSRGQVVARLDPQEHRGVYEVTADEAGVASALADPRLTPVAVAALLLWGRRRFGARWFDDRVGPAGYLDRA